MITYPRNVTLRHVFSQISLIFLLFACGNPKKGHNDGERGGISPTLSLRLPVALTGHKARYVRFLARVRYLEVEAVSKSGGKFHGVFPPQNWESVMLQGVEFPAAQSDSLTVSAKVWDRTQDGGDRRYPALKATTTVSAKGAATGQTENVSMRLSLQVASSDYD